MTLAALALLQADPTPAWVDVLTAVAQIVLALSLLVLAGVVLGIALGLKKVYGRLRPQIEGFRGDFAPVVKNAAEVSENVNYISGAVRQDVERLSQTVTATNDRLNRAAAAAERRLGDFNALLGVVQEEAEDLFIGTASAVRGVRAGTEEFRRLRAEEALGGPMDPELVDDEDFGDDEEYTGPRRREEDLRGLGGPGRREEDDAFDDDAFGDDAFDDDAAFDDDPLDHEITDEELEIRVARRDAERGRGADGGAG